LKTSKDPRHIRRIEAVKSLFAYSFNPQQEIHELAGEVLKNQDEIDAIITKCAPEWPIPQINRLDLGVLRLAVFELQHRSDVPPKVIIDEAVEIGKEFGSQSSGSFINGVLASALKLSGRDKEIVVNESKDEPTPDQPQAA
jgi:N utilization substance protein B